MRRRKKWLIGALAAVAAIAEIAAGLGLVGPQAAVVTRALTVVVEGITAPPPLEGVDPLHVPHPAAEPAK